MKLELFKFRNTKKVYPVFGTTYCGSGIVEWLVGIYEIEEEAVGKVESLNEILNNVGIPNSIYDPSYWELPDDFPDEMAFDHYDNSGGMCYFFRENPLL